MDYKEKYEMAIEGIQEILGSGEDSIKMSRLQLRLQGIIPELAESEDERIRKALIKLVKKAGEGYENVIDGVSIENAIAWLEKQGESTEINPSEFDSQLNRLLGQFKSLPKEELASSLSFYLNVVQNNGTYKEEKKDEQKSTDTQKTVEWEPQTGDTFRKKGTTSPTYHLCEKQEDSIIFSFVENREVGISGGEITLFALKRDYELVERPKSIEDVVEEELNKALQTKAEQKPTIETKLKIEKGKWYVCISQFCNCIEGRVYKATSDSRIMDDFGTEYDMHSDAYKYFRLWTIQDAKDGDVLFAENFDNIGGCVFLFKGLDSWKFDAEGDRSIATGYCCTSITESGNTDFGIQGPDCVEIKRVHPASKEQCDTLMKAMTDARYTFDFEKKELKKVEQKHTEWSDTDYVMQRAALEILMASPKTVASTILKESVIVWLQSLKDRLQPKPKQEWSEEDEKMLDDIIEASTHHCYLNITDINWLKSLKDRVLSQPKWKPSDKQMFALEFVLDNHAFANANNREQIQLLYNDLKKLREEFTFC